MRKRAAVVAWVFSVACGGATAPVPSGQIQGNVTSTVLGALAVPVRLTEGPNPRVDSTQTDSITGHYGPIRVEVGQTMVEATTVPTGCVAAAPQPAAVADGDTVTADVVVDCGGVLVYGRLGTAARGRFPGVIVSVSADGAPPDSTVTDRSGTFTYSAGLLPPGTSNVTLDISIGSGLPVGCTPPSPQTLSYARGSRLEVLFNIVCS